MKTPADKYKLGGHPLERPPAVRYLAPRLNFRFTFLCSRSCASRRFASSTARSTSSGPKARFARSKKKPCNHCSTTVARLLICRRAMAVIPARSCQAYSKQFCLWDLALIIYIVSIIQMVWAICFFVAIVLPYKLAKPHIL